MLNCRQVTRLISQSLDVRLPWYQRLGIRLHLVYCIWCRRYAAQLQWLRKAARQLHAETAGANPQQLSPEAKAQIRARLQEAKNPSSGE